MKPMLATLGDESVLDRENFIFEPKLDGIRAMCFKKKKLKFLSRNQINITDKYPEFNFFDKIDAEECILDGEIVVYDENGKPSFQMWSERDKRENDTPANYVVFDIIYLNGKSLLNEPLYVRKKILEQIVKEDEHLQVCVYTKNGHKLWKLMKEKNMEGVVAKKYDSSYELDSRSSEWIKVKITNDIDCVIVGYTTEKRALTSLALGLYDKDGKDGKLIYVGKVGTGFDEKTMAKLREELDPLVLDEPLIKTENGVIPVEPKLVCQVNYLMMTSNQRLRAPVFVNMRRDKKTKECILTKN